MTLAAHVQEATEKQWVNECLQALSKLYGKPEQPNQMLCPIVENGLPCRRCKANNIMKDATTGQTQVTREMKKRFAVANRTFYELQLKSHS